MKCMATQTTNFKLTKPAYTETADIAVINSNMDTIDTVLANEAEQYDATDAYYVGDYCIYNGVTYRCTVDIETPEAFNSSHWAVVKITEEIADANLKKEQLDDGLAYVAKKVGNNWRLPSGKTANVGDYVIWDGSLGKAKGQIVGGSTNITNSNWEIVSNGALNALNGKVTEIKTATIQSITTLSSGWAKPSPFIYTNHITIISASLVNNYWACIPADIQGTWWFFVCEANANAEVVAKPNVTVTIKYVYYEN